MGYEKIEVSGITLYYKEMHNVSEYDEYQWTDFYTVEGSVPEKKWSWSRFSKVPTGKRVPNYVFRFRIEFWITEYTRITKEELRNRLEREVKLIHREKELERGEII